MPCTLTNGVILSAESSNFVIECNGHFLTSLLSCGPLMKVTPKLYGKCWPMYLIYWWCTRAKWGFLAQKTRFSTKFDDILLAITLYMNNFYCFPINYAYLTDFSRYNYNFTTKWNIRNTHMKREISQKETHCCIGKAQFQQITNKNGMQNIKTYLPLGFYRFLPDSSNLVHVFCWFSRKTQKKHCIVRARYLQSVTIAVAALVTHTHHTCTHGSVATTHHCQSSHAQGVWRRDACGIH